VARTVLVADDSPTIQKKAQGILKGEGYEVETVSNGVAAIKKIPKILPVLVLADVAMPGKDGYEVCDFVKNSVEFKHIPVVLVASDVEPYDEARGARVRADGKVKKPFDPGDLISLVSRFVAAAEAAAPAKVPPPPTVITAPSPEFAVNEPVDEELAYGRKAGPDLGSLSEGVAFAEPVAEEVPAPPPEPAMAPAPEATLEAEIPPPPSAALETVEALPGAMEETPIAAEPVLIEEAPAPEPPPPESERTMLFRSPAAIAPPVLSEEPPPAAPEVLPAEAPPMAASNLESFSLTDAAAGQVRIAPAAEAGTVAAEPEPAPPPAAPAVDPQFVFTIVHRAVVKMSPPALSSQMIEEMARKLADEIVSELNAEFYPPQ